MDPSQSPRFNYVQIDTIAIKLLKQTFDGVISPPVDIDIIAEQLEGFHRIRLLPDLQEKYSVVAFLFNRTDGQCDIFVDSYVDSFNTPRAEFSVAHELGHFVLHPAVFKGQDSIEKVVELNKRISRRYKFLEREANYFAGAILIPHTSIFSDTGAIYEAIIQGKAPDVHDLNFTTVLPKIVATLAARYVVSTQAMQIRLEQLKINNYIKNSLEAGLEILMWE